MPAKFAVVSLWAPDVPAAAHFYRDVLGLTLMPHHGERPHFDVDGVYLTLLKGCAAPAEDTELDRFPLFAIAVEDLEERIARLQKHGVPLPWGLETNGNSRWAMFHDPAGNLIELVQFTA